MKSMGTPPNPPGWARIPAWASGILAAAVIALALYFLLHRLNGIDRGEIARALRSLPPKALWESTALTCFSFVALGGYDMIAVLAVAGHRVSPGRAWLAGCVANAISNTVGFHAVTGTAVRYRLLYRSGLSGLEVAGVTALSWTALGFGFATMLLLAAAISAQGDHWSRLSALVLLVALLLSTTLLGDGRNIRVGSNNLRLPSGKLALAQMGLGAIEMASAIGALYVLMPGAFAMSFPAFSTIYIGAVLLGIVSHAPGGIGVFEAAILALADGKNSSTVFASLLAYRLIYNIAPFVLASLVLAGDELRAAFSSKVDNA